jgi:hypothetical protein
MSGRSCFPSACRSGCVDQGERPYLRESLRSISDRYEPVMTRRLHGEFLAGFTGELAIDLVLA